MVSKFNPPQINELSCVQYFYTMGNSLLDYVVSEKDLGITMNRTLYFTEHVILLYNKANQRFGLLQKNMAFHR